MLLEKMKRKMEERKRKKDMRAQVSLQNGPRKNCYCIQKRKIAVLSGFVFT
jgi:hypothetical protein